MNDFEWRSIVSSSRRPHSFLLLTATALFVAGCAGPGGAAVGQAPDAQQVVSQFEANNGVIHDGFRVNHAKGQCVSGYFESNGSAQVYTSAQLFAPGLRTPVEGRFSIPGGNPDAADDSVPVRGLALSFSLLNGEQWRTAMINAPVFQIRTPQDFFRMLQLRQADPDTGDVNQERLSAFMSEHPDTQPFVQWAQSTTPSTSYADLSFNGLNAFELVDGKGEKHAVRWSFVPSAGDSPAPQHASDLAGDLQQRLAQEPLTWDLVFTFAQEGDPVADSTQAWPSERTQINAGTLVLQNSVPSQQGACRDVDFNPLILPRGMEPSDDPMLQFRADVYQAAQERRVEQERQAQE